MKRIPIRLDTANALKWLGTLYRNPADAIKEHVSNAIDEHLRARVAGEAHPVCRVVFTLEKQKIKIEYGYGMSRREFEDALQRVANSAKTSLDVRQIGRLGIGMFSFMQFGKRCTFFSRKVGTSQTIRVTLRAGSDNAEFETARKSEALQEPGMRILISDLAVDPTKPRGPLSLTRLSRLFAERFDPYIRNGSVEIILADKAGAHLVEPLAIDLPRVGATYQNWPVRGDSSKTLSLDLHYDPSGRGTVGIRHVGVAIVDDLSTLPAYGLEDSVYANGDLRGFIDADFLEPLPARTAFEENEDWVELLDELDRLRPSIECEVDNLKRAEEEEKLTQIKKKAVELARTILGGEEFEDLELLEGLGRKRPGPRPFSGDFAFVPASVRIRVGHRRNLALKARVPGAIPDNSLVTLTTSNPFCAELEITTLILHSSEADEAGVLTSTVPVRCRKETAVPAILTAATGTFIAEARIQVGEPEGEREALTGVEGPGRGISYVEMPFEDGASRHSRYVAGTIQINTLNRDYQREMAGPDEARLAYAALMIGKETMAFNDKTGQSDDYLEKLLTFYFGVKHSREERRKRRRQGARGAAAQKPRRPRED